MMKSASGDSQENAASLAVDQPVATRPPQVVALQVRLNDNAGALVKAYRPFRAHPYVRYRTERHWFPPSR